MADETDLDELARRYLDLWQDQMRALASDPKAAETMSRLIAASGADAAWAAWPAFMAGLGAAPAAGEGRTGKSSEKGPDGASGEPATASVGRPRAGGTTTSEATASGATASGAAAAASASGHGGLDLDGLASRLAGLEERVLALESAARRRSDGAAGRPRGRRT